MLKHDSLLDCSHTSFVQDTLLKSSMFASKWLLTGHSRDLDAALPDLERAGQVWIVQLCKAQQAMSCLISVRDCDLVSLVSGNWLPDQ